jgi:endonuclease YncB( thermonuclease family)
MFFLFERFLLRNADSSVEMVPYRNRPILAKVIEVYDGDTCKVVYLIGAKKVKVSIRLLGIDCPEIRGGQPIETAAALAIRNYVRSLILGKVLRIRLYKHDKYGGRIVGDVYLDKRKTLSDHLIQRGLAVEYGGQKKDPWTHGACKSIYDSLNKYIERTE